MSCHARSGGSTCLTVGSTTARGACVLVHVEWIHPVHIAFVTDPYSLLISVVG